MHLRTDAHQRKDKPHAHGPAALARIARRAAVVASLALLGVLMLAVPADAGIGKYRVGIVTGPPVGAGDYDRMGNANIHHARMTFSWEVIETRPPNGSNGCAGAEYGGFQPYDLQVLGASQKRIKILPTIFGSPDYVDKRSRWMPSTGNARDMNAYKCFLRELVRRYGRGGELVRAKKVAKPITEWQIWNEPSLPIYNQNNKPNPKAYARLVKISSGEIKRIDGKAKVVLAGMPERTKGGMPLKKFLKRFYRVKGIEKKFEVLALHPYASNARGVKGALVRLRKLLRRVGDRRQVVWLTEVGFGTGGKGPNFLVVSEKAQAKKLKAILTFLKKNHRRYKVGTVDWFRWRDLPKPQHQKTDAWPNHAGIYRKNGNPKPACHKYRRFTGARGKCKKIVDEQQTQSASILELPDLGPSSAVLPSPPPE